MPKAIKRKAVKGKTEENIVESLQETLKARKKTLLIGAGAALAIVLIVLGTFYFMKSRTRKFEELNYTGYRLFYGMGTPMPPQERYRQALASFEEARKIKKSPYTLYYIGASRYELGAYDEAIKIFGELKKSFPEDKNYVPLTTIKSAMAYAKTGRMNEALKELDGLVNVKDSPMRDAALAESANILKSMGKEAQAAERLETLKKEYPESPYAKEEKAPAASAAEKKPTKK